MTAPPQSASDEPDAEQAGDVAARHHPTPHVPGWGVTDDDSSRTIYGEVRGEPRPLGDPMDIRGRTLPVGVSGWYIAWLGGPDSTDVVQERPGRRQ